MTAAAGGSVDEQIGLQIHTRMWASNLTQKSLAEDIGIQQSALSRKLRGKRPWLAAEVCTIAMRLGVSPAELMPGPEVPRSPVPPRPTGASSADGGVTYRYDPQIRTSVIALTRSAA